MSEETSESRSRLSRRSVVALLLVVGMTLGVRFLLLSVPRVIERDGIEYLALAEQIAGGDWRSALRHYYPPGYPTAIAAFSFLGLGLEATGRLVSLLSAALGCLALFLWLHRRAGRGAALVGGLVFALHPHLVRIQTQVLSESLFLALSLLAFWSVDRALRRGRLFTFLGTGALAGGAYLVRPEGIGLGVIAGLAILFVPSRLSGWRRGLALGCLLLPLGLAVGGYSLAIREDPIFSYQETAGDLKITKKQDVAALVGLRENEEGGASGGMRRAVARWSDHLLASIPALGDALHVVPGLLLLLGFGLWTLGGLSPPSPAGILGAVAALCFLAGYALVPPNRRHLLVVVTFLLPLIGEWGIAFFRRLGRRRHAHVVCAGILLFGSMLPVALYGMTKDRFILRRVGAWVRARDGIVLSTDDRIPYYTRGLAGRNDLIPRPLDLTTPAVVQRLLARKDWTYLALFPRDLPAGETPLFEKSFERVAVFSDADGRVEIWRR